MQKEAAKDHWIIPCKEMMPKKVMVVAGLTAKGPLKVRIIPDKVKINSEYYIKYVLTPIIDQELVPMFGDDIKKVFTHYDKASPHVSNEMAASAMKMKNKYGLTFITKQDIPVKGADISPMDFHGFGYLKQAVQASRVSTIQGLCKKIKKIWSQRTPAQCDLVYQSWKRRLIQVQKVSGKHIEHIKQIHSHKK